MPSSVGCKHPPKGRHCRCVSLFQGPSVNSSGLRGWPWRREWGCLAQGKGSTCGFGGGGRYDGGEGDVWAHSLPHPGPGKQTGTELSFCVRL